MCRLQLLKLDLDRSRSFMRGPYLWFSLTCQAVAHGVARLIIDYNRHCLPCDQFAQATPEERAVFEREEIAIDIEVARRSLLVVADTWFPGWTVHSQRTAHSVGAEQAGGTPRYSFQPLENAGPTGEYTLVQALLLEQRFPRCAG